MDLFEAQQASKKPLAAAMRPATLDGIVGHEKITAEGSILRRRIKAGQLGATIFYGPPGSGKTSIAMAIGNMIGKGFRPLNAATAKVADVRKIAEEARMTPILMFIDEIHRFSSTQSDDLLDICENGTAELIGATTGNPYHTLTAALISRCHIYKLDPIPSERMAAILKKGVSELSRKGTRISMSEEQISLVAARSGGDARRGLNVIESLCLGHDGEEFVVTDEMISEAYDASPMHHDRAGDQHYDAISAFVKSMRGSDPDATLYWLGYLVHVGEDPRYIARRIMVHASEDVGLADNSALQTAVTAAKAVEHIGYPEARIILAHAALHVARAPKSNSAYRGINLAVQKVTAGGSPVVPMHLRDTHYAGAAKLGHVGYKSPHSDPVGWVEQSYAPAVSPGDLYQSDARGGRTFEGAADAYWEGVTGNKTRRSFDTPF